MDLTSVKMEPIEPSRQDEESHPPKKSSKKRQVKVEPPEMSSGSEGTPLDVQVKLPTRQSLLDKKIHYLKLILQYGDAESSTIRIDIRGEIEKWPKILTKQRIKMEVEDTDPELPSVPPTAVIASQEEEPWPAEEPATQRNDIANNKTRPNLRSSTSAPSTAGAASQEEDPPAEELAPRGNGIAEKTRPSIPCSKCTKTFWTKYGLRRHLFVHLSQEEKEVQMQGWGKEYRKIFLRGRKNNNSNSTTRRPWKCGRCKKIFIGSRALYDHIGKIHPEKQKFQCTDCNRKFVSKKSMLLHMDTIHLGIRYLCHHPTCGSTFSYKSSRERHEKEFHPNLKY